MTDLLVTVLVTQMNLHARDSAAEVAQSALYTGANLVAQRFVTLDVVAGVYLNLHSFLSL